MSRSVSKRWVQLWVQLWVVLGGASAAGCHAESGRVNPAFLGVAVGGFLMAVTLWILNYISRTRPASRATEVIKAVVIALLLGAMIAMLVMIVAQSGIGKVE
ncbi:MAG: hypothetical protein ABI333_00775 [bacterium]